MVRSQEDMVHLQHLIQINLVATVAHQVHLCMEVAGRKVPLDLGIQCIRTHEVCVLSVVGMNDLILCLCQTKRVDSSKD